MFLTTALTTRIAIIVSLVIAMSSVVLLALFPSEQQEEAVAQQQDNDITTNTTTPITTTQSIMPVSSNKTFYVFSAEVEGLDEPTARIIPGEIFSPPIIVVNRGDSVTVNLYNTEQETEERHSFTIDAQPYSVDIDIAGGESGNATFTADQEGIFPYYCKYHLPTMVGQLVVLPQSSPEASSSPAT